MKAVLDSIKPVIENSKLVQINKQAILDFSETITSNSSGNKLNLQMINPIIVQEPFGIS